MKIGILTVVCIAAATMMAPVAMAQRARRAEIVSIQRPGTSYLGIGALEVSPDRAKELKLKEDRGVEVNHVEDDSPAAKAGIKEGDVVLEYNGEKVEGIEQFVRLVRETPPGREVKMSVWRNGARVNLTATIGARKEALFETPGGAVSVPFPQIPPIPPIEVPRFNMIWTTPLLGIEGESLGPEPQLAEFFGVKDGVLVKSVIRNSAADHAGIKAGDVIVKVDDSSVASTREITSALRSNGSKNSFTITVVRNKKEMPISVTIPDRSGRRGQPPDSAFPA